MQNQGSGQHKPEQTTTDTVLQQQRSRTNRVPVRISNGNEVIDVTEASDEYTNVTPNPTPHWSKQTLNQEWVILFLVLCDVSVCSCMISR